MKVQLKFGHHNGERFYSAGEVMECPKKLGSSLIRQGLAVACEEKTEEPKNNAAQNAASSTNSQEGTNPAQTGLQEAKQDQPENGGQSQEKDDKPSQDQDKTDV